MPTLQIRDLPDDVYAAIAGAARAELRSLAQQAVVELRRALNLDLAPQRRRAVIEHLRHSGRCLSAGAASPEELVRAGRDAR